VSDAPGVAETADGAGAIGRAVVGEQAAGPDSSSCEEAESTIQEGFGGVLALVGEDFDVGEAGVIIDAGVDELPADAAYVFGSIAVDAMADPADACQLLSIDVQQVARSRVLIASGWLGRLDVALA